MREYESKNVRIWPYRFEIRLEMYRRREDLPQDTPDLYFDLWLFEDPEADRKLLNRYSGPHPYDDTDQRSTFYAEAAPEEVRRWVEKQRTVLAELGSIATDTERDLEAGAGMSAVRRCHERLTAVADEHRTEMAQLMATIRGPNTNWFPMYAPWSERARQLQETRERNMRYGGGYSSG
ncbi:hypothetical protein [Promicromonospora sp. NPDC023987]|uniref:hypothetical protein n=1 Tax=Promicromonospora sp. NPDC023987 TaxID=3155360 RepID=UPI0033EB459C